MSSSIFVAYTILIFLPITTRIRNVEKREFLGSIVKKEKFFPFMIGRVDAENVSGNVRSPLEVLFFLLAEANTAVRYSSWVI